MASFRFEDLSYEYYVAESGTPFGSGFQRVSIRDRGSARSLLSFSRCRRGDLERLVRDFDRGTGPLDYSGARLEQAAARLLCSISVKVWRRHKQWQGGGTTSSPAAEATPQQQRQEEAFSPEENTQRRTIRVTSVSGPSEMNVGESGTYTARLNVSEPTDAEKEQVNWVFKQGTVVVDEYESRGITLDYTALEDLDQASVRIMAYVNSPTPRVSQWLHVGEDATQISQEGLDFIKQFESFVDHLYNDDAGHCTIGYGHLLHHGNCTQEDREQYPEEITEQEALDFLDDDVSGFEDAVNELVEVHLNQDQFDALVSFAFNVGAGAGGFGGSTLLERLNEGAYDEVPGQLMQWVNAGGRRLRGLVRRRREEGEMFSGD